MVVDSIRKLIVRLILKLLDALEHVGFGAFRNGITLVLLLAVTHRASFPFVSSALSLPCYEPGTASCCSAGEASN